MVEWSVTDRGRVSLGESLCVLESTKATFEVEAEATGRVVHLVDSGSDVKVSQPIALIGASLKSLIEERDRYQSRVREEEGVRDEVKATQKAKDLAQRMDVDLTELVTGGIIRERDVIQYIEGIPSPHRQTPEGLSWDPERKPVVIYGAGRGAVTLKECLDFQKTYQVVCFVDDNPEHPDELCEHPVFHSSQLPEIVKHGIRNLACEIANGSVRLRILKQCDELGIDLISVLHPRAYVAPSVRLGKGNYIKAGAVIETDTITGNCCIVDNGATIAHDNVIGDGCHITPGVSMGSGIHIGDLAIVGIGVSISTGVRVGRMAIISPGTSVTKDVPDYAVVEGVPGKVVGKRKEPTPSRESRRTAP